ncbi:chemotaxis protein CheW [Desulfonema magnum]|uniref:Two component system response regulator, CheW domain-containing n=1 Tax=Desulfonema magnum TaxID=45655 RepID=A0A975GQT4_9BACT|nr:Two component system response regulator, CheW domain-containing [Desulfonema magnum]
MSVDPKNVKILLVEDAMTMRKIEIKTLNSLGYKEITEAKDGNQAIEKLREEKKIDLIISDWNMPGMDGYELLVWVRANEEYKDIPFLMATGQGDIKQERKAVVAGVSSFVAKPFNADELKNKIDEAFGVKDDDKIFVEEVKSRKTTTGKVRLKVAHIQITDHLVLGVLKHLIEKKTISPKYFELETQCMRGWNPVKDSLGKGTVDAACILAPIAMDLFSFGSPIKLILFAHKSGSIFVRNKQGIYHKPFQNFFKNKSFIIPHNMSVHHMLCHMFFTKIGLNPGVAGERGINVNFEVVDPILMPEFLRNNPNSGGFMVAEPLGTKAIASGIAELQFLSNELWEQHPCCVVAMREDIIGQYPDAVHEFTEMLVQAGEFIQKKPELAAEVAVDFLDPNKKLGLKVPLLKNVLTESQGIKTTDLFPEIQDLDKIQQYMANQMGLGSLIDLEKFVDTQFADAVFKERAAPTNPSVLHDTASLAIELLKRGVIEEDKASSKAMLNKEGKYLTFNLGDQEFGIDILKIREIIGMIPIRTVPQLPRFIKGVINLRGKVIPVMDLRLRFGMKEFEYTERTCIVVLEHEIDGKSIQMGIAVDSVSEVLPIKASVIEDTPSFGVSLDTRHILAVAKIEGSVKILLDIDHVIFGKDNNMFVEDLL